MDFETCCEKVKSGDKKYKVLKLDKAPIGVRACKSTEFGGM